nr:drug resistance MFS transporter, drug:H+ antiporter-2 (14 Spanner) (DHA2) family [uncultured bacterium]
METTTTSEARGYRYRWYVLAVVLIADVMDLLDATVANLAGPSIRAELGGSESTLQWILASYTLTFAIGLIISARLGDLIGRKQMFVVGMAGFTLASLLCGLAPTPGLLIAARVLQGLLGAVMIPQGFAMVKQAFHPDDLQKAFIPFGPIMALSAVAGPILAGVLIDGDLFGTGWRMIFLINVPIGLVGAYLSWRYLPDIERDSSARLDVSGSLILALASGLLVYPLVQGRELDWPLWTFGMIAAALVLFVVFARHERRSAHPVIEPSLFGHRGYVAGLFFLGVFFVAMTGFSLVSNLFIQIGLGYSPFDTGLAQTPLALGMALGAVVSGAVLGPRLGRHVLHLGLAVAALGLAWLALVVGRGTGIDGWDLAPALFLSGFGVGLIFAPLFDIILADLGDREVGSGSGLLNAVQQFAGAFGVAVLGTLLFGWVPDAGWFVATQHLIWVCVGCYAAAFVAVFALPMRARGDAVV